MRGFTLFELLLVMMAFGVVLILFIPSSHRNKVRVKRINCTCNLKQIGLSFSQCALDHDDKFPMQLAVTNGGTMELVDRGWVWRISR
jgi:prepilin-type N-terminal cleavage/methylation domain-containing protein